jgi:hypothetical protein
MMEKIMSDDRVLDWLAIRKLEGPKIDPETAEVNWWYALTLDPYGVDPDLPEGFQQIGREYFACRPGSDIWVQFGDLTRQTRERLWEKHSSKLAFPAGLEPRRQREPQGSSQTSDLSSDEAPSQGGSDRD